MSEIEALMDGERQTGDGIFACVTEQQAAVLVNLLPKHMELESILLLPGPASSAVGRLLGPRLQ